MICKCVDLDENHSEPERQAHTDPEAPGRRLGADHDGDDRGGATGDSGSPGQVRVAFERRGSGPGEMESPPVLFMGRGDTLFALEGTRGTLFDASLRPMGTQRLPSRAPSTLAVLSDGRVVANWRVSLPDGRVSQAALLDATWGLLKPLEPAPPETAVRGMQMAASFERWPLGVEPGTTPPDHVRRQRGVEAGCLARRAAPTRRGEYPRKHGDHARGG